MLPYKTEDEWKCCLIRQRVDWKCCLIRQRMNGNVALYKAEDEWMFAIKTEET